MKRYICDWCKKETDKLTEGWGTMHVVGAPPDHDYEDTEHMCPVCREHLKLG